MALDAYAMDNLRYIRRTMERAGEFTAVPGLGGVLMGSTALAAAWLAEAQTRPGAWLAVWVLAAVAAVGIGTAGALWKSRRAGLPLLSGPGRKFVAGFAPAMAAGAVLTGALYHAGLCALLPGLWLLLYGAAVIAGGAASVKVVPLMGACFMLAGSAALFARGVSPDVLLAAGFGGLHILFGTIITVKYGG
ncbi:MAG: hypothetical protein ACLQVN_03530 [Bryobacteraceae bacterium]